jgi:TonB-linked SusC/RagA family outer membrane protein
MKKKETNGISFVKKQILKVRLAGMFSVLIALLNIFPVQAGDNEKVNMNQSGAIQEKKVTGKISDEKGEPMLGVTILVQGTNIGVISNIDGNYTINVPDEKSILAFSFVGFLTKEIKVENQSVIDVIMTEDFQKLEEVVIVAYGTQKKSHLTGSVSSVKSETLNEVPVSRVDQALQGKLAGVQVLNQNPEAGAAPKIRVRGMGSISASSDPLVVVDGFPVPDGLAMVSMGDVESIEVLKDASSAALYGSRAAGGVILVTTKSGNISKPKYNFKMYTGTRSPLKLPKMASTSEYYAMLYNEAELRKQDPALDGTAATMLYSTIGTGDQAAYLIEKLLDRPTDWMDEALRNYGAQQNYMLSASGGDKNIKYFISGNYNKEEGIMKASEFNKYSFRAKADVKLSKNVMVGINLVPTYSSTITPEVDLTNYQRYPSWLPIRHNEATAALVGRKAGDYAQASEFLGVTISGLGYNNEMWHITGANPSGSSVQNPVSVRERTSNTTDDYKLQANTYLTIDLLPNLQFKTSNGIYASYREYNKKEKTEAKNAGVPNSLTRQTTFHTDILSENTLNYTKTVGFHEFGGLLGFTMQRTENKYNAIVGTNFPDEEMLSYNLASALILDSPTLPGTTSFYYSESMVSLIGRLNYSYKGKYMFSASMRSDGSSKFAAGNKWGQFPAFSAGWRVSEEGFLKDAAWLSNLKLRVSYGLTGNNNIPQYSYMNSVNTSNYVTGSGTGLLVPGMASNNLILGNPDITWEQTMEANYGLDMGFFKNRLYFTVEYYNSNTVQLLLQQPSMFITGHQTFWNNIGEVNNQGLEMEIATTNINKKDFTWKTSANFSINKNKLLNYGNKEKEDNFGERNEVYRAAVGEPSIQYYGYRNAGVYTTLEEVAAAKAITDENGVPFTYTKYSPVLGGLKVLNLNGDNRLDTEDRVVLGDPFPDFVWGLTNTLTYKGFDLTFLFQGVQGIDLINGNLNYNESLRLNTVYTNTRYISPMFPGDGKTTFDKNTSGGDLMLSDYAIEDGSYIALRDFMFGYKIPNTIVKKLKVSEVRAYFSAQNMVYLMAKDYRGVNPEARKTSGSYTSPLIDGYQRGVFPINRTFTAGVEITF